MIQAGPVAKRPGGGFALTSGGAWPDRAGIFTAAASGGHRPPVQRRARGPDAPKTSAFAARSGRHSTFSRVKRVKARRGLCRRGSWLEILLETQCAVEADNEFIEDSKKNERRGSLFASFSFCGRAWLARSGNSTTVPRELNGGAGFLVAGSRFDHDRRSFFTHSTQYPWVNRNRVTLVEIGFQRNPFVLASPDLFATGTDRHDMAKPVLPAQEGQLVVGPIALGFGVLPSTAPPPRPDGSRAARPATGRRVGVCPPNRRCRDPRL